MRRGTLQHRRIGERGEHRLGGGVDRRERPLLAAAGGGEGESYEFDMAAFGKNFNLDILKVTYGIQALAKEDILSYNEMVFKPSTAMFTSSKKDLEDFENNYPHLEPVIKGLLRSYEGIYDFPVSIYESSLARFLRMDIISDSLK